MSDADVALNCAPTLAGIKAGNLFNQIFESREEMLRTVRGYNTRWKDRNVCMVPVSYKDRHALLYVYRPDHLNQILRDQRAVRILKKAGYQAVQMPESDGALTARCIAHLITRLGQEQEFPHEIGLFLDYPPEDVEGFIQNRACNCKLVGTWKVYGDVTEARKKFERYRSCTAAYCRALRKGCCLEQMMPTA